MRSRCMTVFMALVAASVVTAFAATSAFAERQLPAFVVHNSVESFTGHFTGKPFFKITSGEWDYASGTISGEINTAGGEIEAGEMEDKEVRNVTLTFSKGSEGACNSQTSEKELVWSKLHGWLGYIGFRDGHPTTKEVGLLLFSSKNPWNKSLLTKCFSSVLGEMEYKGGILLKFSNPGEESSDHQLEVFNTKADQEQFMPLGGIHNLLELGVEKGTFFEAGLTGTTTFETPYAMHIEH
jgi:hypothetical protein